MDGEALRAAFLALFALGLGVDWLLSTLNQREALRHPTLPPEFRSWLDPETFFKARNYTLDQLGFGKITLLFSAAITLGLLFSGVLPAYHAWLGKVAGGRLHQGALFLAGIFLLQGALRLPLSLYSVFRIEGKYGFNTMTLSLYVRDLAKGLLVSLALGLPLLYAVLALVAHAGPRWWLWAFAVLVAFQLFLMVAYPLFIAPLFNKFKPLEGDLQATLMALAAALRFPARGIYVMDGSRRSLHSNAYFTGFGRLRRIVLFDTLLGQMDTSELKSILAHEIGHYRLHHIYRRMAAQIALLGLLFYLLSLALRWPALYQAFGFAAIPDGPAPGLFLALTIFSSLSILWSPLENFFSRKHEYEADAFAVGACREPEAMQSALVKLSRKNLSNPTPHPWYSAFHYSHPTLAERLRAIDRLGQGSTLPLQAE